MQLQYMASGGQADGLVPVHTLSQFAESCYTIGKNKQEYSIRPSSVLPLRQ